MNYEEWRDRLGEANDPELYPLAHQDWLVTEGGGQFWATDDAAIITLVHTYPSGAVACETYAAAGDMQTMIDTLKPAIEAWAMSNGCTHCMVEGRRGWARVHSDYRHHKTILVKEL